MDKIKLRQICFLFAAMMPITKTIVYPSTLAYHAKNDLLLAAFCSFLLEGTILLFVLLLARKTDKTFFELIEKVFGKIGARIIFGLFALFFALAALFPLMEQKNFVTQELYENVPTFISFAPFFAVCFFACTKGFKTLGRIADVTMPVFVLCFSAILLLAFPHAEWEALLPIGGTGVKGVLGGAAKSVLWYTDCLYPLFFLGHFEYEKRGAGKVMLAYGIGAAATLIFLALFYGIYADTAVLQQNALAQISKYTTANTSLGRIDLLFVFALTLILVFYNCVPVQLCTHCLCKTFNCKPLIPAAIVNAALLTLTVFFNYSFTALQKLFTQNLWFVFVIFAYAVPLIVFLFTKKEKSTLSDKKEKRTKKRNSGGTYE